MSQLVLPPELERALEQELPLELERGPLPELELERGPLPELELERGPLPELEQELRRECQRQRPHSSKGPFWYIRVAPYQ
jgi:hypothetical protein